MRRPRLLDLYCGAGGAAMGYYRAGFDVYGVDKIPQPHYPFWFRQADALETLANEWRRFDAVHASPPCQGYSALTIGSNWYLDRTYPMLVPATRIALDKTGLPWVIENVVGAPVRKDIRLCGEMFGLEVIRHRDFECSGFEYRQPRHKRHRGRVRGYRYGEYIDGPYFPVYGDGGGKGTITDWQRAMGINWMPTKKELAESIPPAYTKFIGRMLYKSVVGGDVAWSRR